MLDKRCFAVYFASESDPSRMMIAEFKNRRDAVRAIARNSFALDGQINHVLFTGEKYHRWELEEFNGGLRPIKP